MTENEQMTILGYVCEDFVFDLSHRKKPFLLVYYLRKYITACFS
jgi:hypothetical protein